MLKTRKIEAKKKLITDILTLHPGIGTECMTDLAFRKRVIKHNVRWFDVKDVLKTMLSNGIVIKTGAGRGNRNITWRLA